MSYQSQNELRVTSNHFFVLLWQVDHSFVLMRGNDLVQTKRERLRSLDIFHSLSKRHRTGSRRLGFSVLFQSYEYVEHHHLEGGKGILMKKRIVLITILAIFSNFLDDQINIQQFYIYLRGRFQILYCGFFQLGGYHYHPPPSTKFFCLKYFAQLGGIPTIYGKSAKRF